MKNVMILLATDHSPVEAKALFNQLGEVAIVGGPSNDLIATMTPVQAIWLAEQLINAAGEAAEQLTEALQGVQHP